MRFWQSLSFTPTSDLVELARAAEAAGFHGVLVADHVFHPQEVRSRYPYSPDGRPYFDAATEWPEPWVAIGAMAAVTRRLCFATGIYVLPLRHPLVAAKAVATAAVLSQGRVALGVGAGWMREEFDTIGAPFEGRGNRLDEAIGVLRAVWKGGTVEHHGKHFDFAPLSMSPVPPGPIPIYVGGTTAAALRRAALLGDGWVGAGNAPEEVPGVLETLRRLRRESGREREPFESIVAVTAPPEPDLVRRLEDAGVTSLVSWPLSFTLGPDAPLAARRAALERYGNEVIARAG